MERLAIAMDSGLQIPHHKSTRDLIGTVISTVEPRLNQSEASQFSERKRQ
jgi:hypothetical protein